MAGALFAMGWFIFIDGAVIAGESPNKTKYVDLNSDGHVEALDKVIKDLRWYYYIPGVLGSLALVMLNCAPLRTAEDDGGDVFDEDNPVSYPMKLRFWLFLSFTCAFCTVAGGVWIFVAEYLGTWTGIAIMLQPILILGSSMLLLLIRMSGMQMTFQMV
eukprot:CAMPEP_0119126350 /NCGR_PEP_ID=MMETSP1310-20130426/5307_1 /TAXON_ID=464262 /ORGANISM="Genus nov. species nov., Strain RCC2339" /LENGTH=158 /DNA_ID=CAMNT_0007116503 /DNA_START=119 /DNA_END=595 /DNA_ORIENTATION=+